MNFLKINFVFILFSCLATASYREEKVADIISEALTWQLKQIPTTREISQEQRERLQKFSSDEILGGFILTLERYEQDERTRMGAYVGNNEFSMLQFNAGLVPDTSFLRAELAREKEPRRFFYLSSLAYSFTRARNVDFIPEQFNSLFRDGRVIDYQGENTPSYADDVSKMAYMWIVGSLDRFGATYEPAPRGGGIDATHERQVNHLAKWLISNWPGCEDFTLSDQNVPVVLRSSSATRISGQPKASSEDGVKPSVEAFKISWPLVAAAILFACSLVYWGKKRFAR